MDSGCRIHVPALNDQVSIFDSRCTSFQHDPCIMARWIGKKTTHVALRRNKAFMGFSYNSIEYIINQTIDDLRSIKCVFGSGSVMVWPWSWFYQAIEVHQLADMLAGSDALSVSCLLLSSSSYRESCSHLLCFRSNFPGKISLGLGLGATPNPLEMTWKSPCCILNILGAFHPWTVQVNWLPVLAFDWTTCKEKKQWNYGHQ